MLEYSWLPKKHFVVLALHNLQSVSRKPFTGVFSILAGVAISFWLLAV
jgi:hypothetical protein